MSDEIPVVDGEDPKRPRIGTASGFRETPEGIEATIRFDPAMFTGATLNGASLALPAPLSAREAESPSTPPDEVPMPLLAPLHVDGPVHGGKAGTSFVVPCSCGRRFYGADPDAAGAAQLDHVEAELGEGTPATRAARAAWRSLPDLGVEPDVEYAEEQIVDAIANLLHLATFVGYAYDYAVEAAMMHYDQEQAES